MRKDDELQRQADRSSMGRSEPIPTHHGADLWPVFEFRPVSANFGRSVDPLKRYAAGAWIDDDGEYDLAFSHGQIVLYVEPPYQRNIIWQGLTTHWTGYVAGHPRDGNPWHYMLREGETQFGGDWRRDSHPNALAGRSGMNVVCGHYQSATGRHIEFQPTDPHIVAGLVRDRATKELLRPPDRLVCCYCGDGWAASLADAEAGRCMPTNPSKDLP